MRRTEFIATGFHVPDRLVTNDDLATMMDTSDDWIVQRSGIKTRYWVSDGETGATLGKWYLDGESRCMTERKYF